MVDIVGGLLFVAAAVSMYFIPSGLAYTRKHHNRQAILALNLFFGWTLIGWVACLVWALTRPPERGA
jgi:hypothetical protein